ncbi:hypothetical protein [Algibacter sp. PT7-4]
MKKLHLMVLFFGAVMSLALLSCTETSIDDKQDVQIEKDEAEIPTNG